MDLSTPSDSASISRPVSCGAYWGCTHTMRSYPSATEAAFSRDICGSAASAASMFLRYFSMPSATMTTNLPPPFRTAICIAAYRAKALLSPMSCPLLNQELQQASGLAVV